MSVPAIAIVTPNTLAAIGLAEIIHRMMPGADTCLFPRFSDLAERGDADVFFHFFVSPSEVLAGAAFFLRRQHKTIVLVHGEEKGQLPQGFHSLNVFQGEGELVRSILALARRSHGSGEGEIEVVRRARLAKEGAKGAESPRLTPREREVLRGVIGGRINKEIAADLGVSLATVITHRKNLTAKLGTRSVAAMTIFAVAHGIVRGEDI